ncbi:bifunctional pyr operon transcriptional regulator/uracil phosphoribosyltransferase PyrR [Nitrococcus mobilis]|uniref:Uracil phosphoribosyltransferase n=1 Tax=Nitrococcus mobilis Nb-231 TaxID=314278 RepID=A4BSB2_9GAMM|nr:bifunctional pyr operon transcriptional regulator/uracil phosphoribosyltransferase PyrR [Nitrococcus mobilis]EAR21372.1 Uracil phosphoribosyltransferase [Nitrococcus mobilis Nb-231]
MKSLPEVDHLLTDMSQALRALVAWRDPEQPVALIGIHTGGVWLAERLHRLLGLASPIGALNIHFHRDDFGRIGVHPRVQPSHLPFDVDGCLIILIDDVLYSGRTVRAALNEIFDYGRPAAVRLAVLVDRGGRELPIAADVVGAHLKLNPAEQIKLLGPSPLKLSIERGRT